MRLLFAHAAKLVYAVCFILVAAATMAAGAAESELVGVLSVVLEEDVADQLELSPKQIENLIELVDARESAGLDEALKHRDLQPEARREKLAPFRRESERLALEMLTPAQRAKLLTIRLKRDGLASLGNPQVAIKLKLSPTQLKDISKLLATRSATLRKVDDDQIDTVRKMYEKQLAAVLDKDQLESWNQLANADQAPASKAADPPATQPVAEPPVQPIAKPQVKRETRAGGNAVGKTAGDGKLRFNFRYAPWQDVLDWFAEQADLSLILDAAPPGTFNYTDPRSYTPAEAIDLLNSVLLTKGYTLVRRERMLVLVNLEDGIPPNLVPSIPLAELDRRGEFELVSTLFHVSRMTPAEAEVEIKKLLGPQGSIVVLPKAGQIQVTETAGRLRVIRSVIEAVENPGGGAAGELRQFPLRHVSADGALDVIRQLLGISEETNATADGSLRLALDPAGGSILATGRPDRLARLAEVLEAIDVPLAGTTAEPGVLQAPQLEVYTIATADPESALQVLQTLLAGVPGVRLTVDSKTGNLVALARPAEHATIRATLAQMQRDARQVDVIQLRRVDPQMAVLAINKLFGGGEESKTAAPTVDADPNTRTLLVRGSEAQLAQIQQLLEKMGESQTADADDPRRNVRLLQLSGRTSRAALKQIEQIWPTLRTNKIRIVTPSTLIPTYRSSEFRKQQSDGAGDPPRKPTPEPPAKAAPPAKPGLPQSGELEDRSEGKSAGQFRRRSYSRLASFQQIESTDAADAGEVELVQQPTESTAADDPPAAKPGTTDNENPAQGAPIIVAPGPTSTMIASDDVEALDQFEALLTTIANQTSGREFAVFYLKYAKATVVSGLLREIFGGEASGGDEGGGLLGDIAGEAGGGLLGGLLGLGGGGGIVTAGVVDIVADARLNALVVQAKPADLDTVEQLLSVLDQETSPEEIQLSSRPKLIPIYNTSADAVAKVVREIYQDRLASSSGSARARPSPEAMIRALRGSRGRGSSSQRGSAEPERMSVGVDTRSNSLVVVAPQHLFEEIEALVAQLDKRVVAAQEAVRVVTLRRSNPQALSQALKAVLGDAVKTSPVEPVKRQPKAKPTNGDAPNGKTNQDANPNNDPAAMLRRLEMIERFRRDQRIPPTGGSRRGGSGNR